MAEKQTRSTGAGRGRNPGGGEFASLLEKNFKPKSDRQKRRSRTACQDARRAGAARHRAVSDDAVKIDRGDHRRDRPQAHRAGQPDPPPRGLPELEGTWRGLHHLVNNTETDEMLKIRVFNISKKDLARPSRSSRAPPGTRARSSRRSTKRSTASSGGEPYGCLVGDYHFDHTRRTSRSSAAWPDRRRGARAVHRRADPDRHAHGLVAGAEQPARPDQDLPDARVRRLALAARERGLPYIGLAMPRFLSRIPYGAKTNPVEEFAFEEDTEGADHNKYTWSNSAYAMAVNINRAFKQYGWCTRSAASSRAAWSRGSRSTPSRPTTAAWT
jgi:type VI secretion system protein ImpC